MKTIKILIASLILVSQTYAFSNGQRNLLLGLGVGAVFAHALYANDVHVKKVHHTKTVYVDRHVDKRSHNKHAKKHARKHNKHYNAHHRGDRHYTKRQQKRFEREHRRDRHQAYASNHNYRSHNYRY
mgnify:CR=1 FL=1